MTLAFWDSDFTSNIIYQKLLSDKLGVDLGYVFENVVAQMLVASGQKLFYHTWKMKNSTRNYEIDFLLTRESKICPVEVKSSQSSEHKSIDEFQKKFSARILHRYLVHTKDLHKEQDMLCIPVYMTPFL